ncbi:MAG: hypothetical protein DYG94_06525 [Leptolyngbya sp. PLA3]|nr:MAG: hypothetical protein EDM82_05805 [Cyanobacteria bacterium CYA]MCE7968385.1 hypothetical protein [Leptolyngbya sp. PL-A3]
MKIIGPETEGNTVPADVLVQTLERLQKLVLIAAAAKEGKGMNRRFKPSAELRQRHTLRCAIPTAGSYAIAVSEVDECPQDDLPNMDEYAALDDVYQVAEAVIEDNPDRVRQVIPDAALRSLMLRTLQDMAPSEGSEWLLDFAVGTKRSRRLGYGLRRDVTRVLRSDQPEQEEGTVIGELQRIFFDQRKFEIRHPVTESLISCSYQDEVESDILESRRDYIQVTGQVYRTPEGHVSSVSDVTSIERVDTSPFQISEIEVDGVRLRIAPPLQVNPELDEETKQVFLFSDDELNLFIAAPTRAELYEEIVADLAFSYSEYVRADDETLSPAAVELKRRLSQRLQEDPTGAA